MQGVQDIKESSCEKKVLSQEIENNETGDKKK
jgi:hypothetical protein